MVKVYLSQKDIAFTEYNISTDTDALRRLVEMGHRTTPVTVIQDEKVVGYSTAKLDAALRAASLMP